MAAAAATGTNTELGRVLNTLGFPTNILRHLRDHENLTTLQELNQVHRDLIPTIFTGLTSANPPIPYTTMQLSRFKTLHSYLRRMANPRTLINPLNITTDLLIQELEYAEDTKAKETDKRSLFPRRNLNAIAIGFHSRISLRIFWIVRRPQENLYHCHMLSVQRSNLPELSQLTRIGLFP
jgi:hypothetical protein